MGRPLAIVTGASTGIGYELARCCAEDGFDLIIAADEPEIKKAAADFVALGAKVDAIEADLATIEGVDKLYAMIGGRQVDALLANAGRGLGKGFLDQDFDDVLQVVNTNITGTIYLIQKVGQDMRAQKRGRILITGSIAGFIPGTYQAVYNASKAFLDSFSFALRAERGARSRRGGGAKPATRALTVDCRMDMRCSREDAQPRLRSHARAGDGTARGA